MDSLERLVVDGTRLQRKTRRVLSNDERSRVGRLLKRLREDHEWDQRDLATKAGLSVGTVQAIEYNKYKVSRDNIDKYAAIVGTTTHKLLHPDPQTIAAADPMLADLNREHLAIARGYMRAVKAIRAAVEILVTPAADHFPEELAEIVLELKRASEHVRDPQLAYWMTVILARGDVLKNIARRLDSDPNFEERLVGLLDDPKGNKK